jgi:preprotein translocase subunit SecG
MNQTEFQCKCSNPNLYYGIYCEKKWDLCQNSSVCYNNQGYCILNGTQPMCKCLMGCSGVNCEILSTALAAKKVITRTTTIIAIIVMVCFVLIVIFFDYTKFFLMKNKKKNKNNKKHEDEKKHEKMI